MGTIPDSCLATYPTCPTGRCESGLGQFYLFETRMSSIWCWLRCENSICAPGTVTLADEGSTLVLALKSSTHSAAVIANNHRLLSLVSMGRQDALGRWL